MSQTITLHVAPNGDGTWLVQKSGGSRASTKAPSQAKAIEYARDLAKSQNTELYVHGLDGRILRKKSYTGASLTKH